ncbi:MAG: hypothetical protein ACRDRL_06990 [Sciscionella sp.]
MPTECAQCGFTTIQDERVIDPQGKDRGSRTVCTHCGAVERDDVVITPADLAKDED